MKVLTLVGTRPEIIKLSRIIAALDQQVNHILVHSGQNYDYELNEVFFKDLEIRKPDHFLKAAGNTACESIANVLVKTEQILFREQPDAFLIYGDTNSCLGAIAAKRHKIPVFHLEAGNRCFDERVPEEINRRILDHISDINMPLTERGRDYLKQEGIRGETIVKTGSCMGEVLDYYRPGIAASNIVEQLGLNNHGYFVFSAHREENVDVTENLENLARIIENLSTIHRKPVIFSVHPRTRIHLQAQGIQFDESSVRLLKPLGFFDYIRLQQQAFCVLSDSGTITEESSLLNFPAVTLRQAHERPEGMDAGTLIMSDLNPERVAHAVSVITTQPASAEPIPDYQTGAVSRKVLNAILSYSDYIQRTVWRNDQAIASSEQHNP